MTPEVAIVSNRELRNNTIDCDCSFNNTTTCRIINMQVDLKTRSLRGKLPSELAELHYLQTIDLCISYLSGSIPMEWVLCQTQAKPHLYVSSLFLLYSLCANRLSGRLPSGLQNFKNLRILGVEANQFSGPIPDELGNLTSLKGLQLGSNQFTGNLPDTLARLVNLEDFRVSDNNFNGTIPAFIGNWSRLQKLYLYASGLKGPIPDEIARLENLTNLSNQSFPSLSSRILRNVSLSGQIPSYIWKMRNLKLLDLSFNNLTGDVHGGRAPEYTYLTGNRLSGEVESGVFLKSNAHMYGCISQFLMLKFFFHCISNINTYQSSHLNNLNELLPCAGPTNYTSYQRILHINCGGDNIVITKYSHKITYQADNSKTKAATNQQFKDWGISNTGEFFSDGNSKAATSNTDDTYIISTNLTLPGVSPLFYTRQYQSADPYASECIIHALDSILRMQVMQLHDSELSNFFFRFSMHICMYNAMHETQNHQSKHDQILAPTVVRNGVPRINGTLFSVAIFRTVRSIGMVHAPIFKGKSLMRPIGVVEEESPNCSEDLFGSMLSIPRLFIISIEITFTLAPESTRASSKISVIGALIAVTLLALGLYAHKRCIGDNYTRERGKSSLKLEWEVRQNICVGIAKGLEFLHEG
ncbi:unnamed protein product, partial [Brassica oleracea var. botrytis]